MVAVRNPNYWNPAVHPLIGQITIKGVPDIASVTAGLQTGAIQGDYGLTGAISSTAYLFSPWADRLGAAG